MLSSVADWRPTWGQQLCLFVLLRPYPQPDHALTQESLSFWAERMSLQKKSDRAQAPADSILPLQRRDLK